MEKDKKRINVSVIDIYLKPTYEYNDAYHANKVNAELDRIQNDGGTVIAMETFNLNLGDYDTDSKLRTIITYKV